MIAWALLRLIKNKTDLSDPKEKTHGRRRRSSRPIRITITDEDTIPHTSLEQGASSPDSPKSIEIVDSSLIFSTQKIISTIAYYLNPSDIISLMQLSKETFACMVELLYRKPYFHSSGSYYRFLSTLSQQSPLPMLPYGIYVHSIEILEPVSEEVLMGDVEMLLSKCPNISSMKLEQCQQVSNLFVHFMTEYSPQLASLELPGCTSISDSFISLLVEKCPHLKNIDFSFSNVSLSSIVVLLQSDLPLETLILGGIHDPSISTTTNTFDQKVPSDTALLITEMNRRSSLSISEGSAPESLSSKLFDFDAEDTLVFESKESPESAIAASLKVLVLSRTNLTDSMVDFICQYTPNLEELSIDSCPFITDTSLISIASQLKQLKYLDVSFSYAITDYGILHLAGYYPKAPGPDNDKNTLNEVLPPLTQIDISGCSQITDKSISRLFKAIPSLTTVFVDECPTLESSFSSPDEGALHDICVDQIHESKANDEMNTRTALVRR